MGSPAPPALTGAHAPRASCPRPLALCRAHPRRTGTPSMVHCAHMPKIRARNPLTAGREGRTLCYGLMPITYSFRLEEVAAMNGFGRGGGRARGGAGYGWRLRRPLAAAPGGYRYIGSCRCGLGPNAYYQDQAGRVLSASSLFSTASGAPTASAEDVEQLKAEKAELERRLRVLEDRLRGAE